MHQKTFIETEKSRFYVIDNFCDDLYEHLKILPLLNEPPIKIMGKVCHQRRDIGFFSDTSEGYRYSNQIAKSRPLKDYPILVDLINKVNNYLNASFNGILVNRYVDGTKYISAHSDNEDGLSKKDKNISIETYAIKYLELIQIMKLYLKIDVYHLKLIFCKLYLHESKFFCGGIVAGIAFGPSKRNIRIREIGNKKIVLNYDNIQRSLYVMDGNFQSEFTHEIPKQLKVLGERISLTFRTHTK